MQQTFEAQQCQLSFQITFSSKFWQFFWIILRNSLAKSPQNSLLVICLTTKLKTWFYEEIQGMCILNSLMEFISWTKEGPEFTSNILKNPCGLTLSLLIYTSMYALKQLLVHSHRFAVVSVQLVLVCSKTIRNWHERWYFTSLSRGIGIQFSTSNNTTSRNGHWLVYRHCAKLPKEFQVQNPRTLDTLQIFWVYSTTFNKCANVQ